MKWPVDCNPGVQFHSLSGEWLLRFIMRPFSWKDDTHRLGTTGLATRSMIRSDRGETLMETLRVIDGEFVVEEE